MMKKLLTVTLLLAAALGLQAKVYNVRDFGAAGDGVKIDSPAINAAIEAAAAKGGGVIYFPKGVYSSYSIRLKDNITLRLDEGAVIKAAKPTAEQGYDIAEPNEWDMYQDFGHSHWKNSLIWGIGLKNLKFEGKGLIDGTDALSRGLGRQGPIAEANKAIALKECKNVTIKGISLLNSGHFSLLLTGVDNLVIDNVLCDTNRDAFDIDCCANVKITNCVVNSLNDDGIVLKSSYGLGYPKATENVLIKNCTVSGYDPGTVYSGTYGTTITAAPDRDGPTGRVKFGTESNGGYRNISISGIVVKPSADQSSKFFGNERGTSVISLEVVDGGVLENVQVSNIVAEGTEAPIFIRLGNRARGYYEGQHIDQVGTLRNVTISDVTVSNAGSTGCSITGLPDHCVEDITLRNIRIEHRGGGKQTPVPTDEKEKEYPEATMWGPLPAHGFFVRHARGVVFQNVVVKPLQPDVRPEYVKEDCD